MELTQVEIEAVSDLRQEKRRSLHLPVFPDFHSHLVYHAVAYAIDEGGERAGYVLLMSDSHEGHEHVTLLEMYLASSFEHRYDEALDLVRDEREPKAYLVRSDDCIFETALLVQGYPMETSMVVLVGRSLRGSEDVAPAPSVSLEPLDYPYLREAHELYAHVRGDAIAPSVGELEGLLDDDRMWVLVREGEVTGIFEFGPAGQGGYGSLEALVPHTDDSEAVWGIREASRRLAKDGLTPMTVVDARDERKIGLFREAGYYTGTAYLMFYDAEAGRPSVPTIERGELWGLIQQEADVRVIDVLGEGHWSEAHIPGAEWMDFKSLTREARRRFAKDEPIVLYCNDYT